METEIIESVGFIGAGNMAFALAKGMKNRFSGIRIFFTDPVAERMELFKSEADGSGACACAEEVCRAAQIVFICVKPQAKESVLPLLAAAEKPVVSIMAGVTIAVLEEAMPKAEIIRVMPNLNCLVGESASAFSCAPSVTPAHRETVRRLLSASGTATEVEEPLLDAVTGLSGSGPAFAARLMAYFIRAGEEAGLSRKTAVELTRQTFLGTVRFLNETGTDEETLIERVSSPGGTTVAGRRVLESSEAEGIIRGTVAAAVERSRELGKM